MFLWNLHNFCCFFGMMKSCCRENEKFKPKIPSSIVCVLSVLLFSACPETKHSKFDLFMKEKWWKILRADEKKKFFSIRQISPGAYHVQRENVQSSLLTSAVTRKKLINYLIRHPWMQKHSVPRPNRRLVSFLNPTRQLNAMQVSGRDKNKIINKLIMQYKCISCGPFRKAFYCANNAEHHRVSFRSV